jgi:hypothetical protein
MKGIYIYCIRWRGKGGHFNIAYKDIEAVVREVDLEKFSSEEIAKRAKEDIGWITDQAKAHEKIIERAMKRKQSAYGSTALRLYGSVIPMKFGTIFKDKASLENTLKNNYRKFKNLLKKLEGREEWSVKIYIKEDKLKESLKKGNKKIRAQDNRRKSSATGIDYFEELEVEKMVDEALEKEAEKLASKIFNELSKISFTARKNNILPKEFVGKEEPMILNCAYLVEKKNLKSFDKKVQAIRRLYPECIVECTGPWPAYNFV